MNIKPVGELVEVGVATLQTALKRAATDMHIHLERISLIINIEIVYLREEVIRFC
jgi:hypothetical protein